MLNFIIINYMLVIFIVRVIISTKFKITIEIIITIFKLLAFINLNFVITITLSNSSLTINFINL